VLKLFIIYRMKIFAKTTKNARMGANEMLVSFSSDGKKYNVVPHGKNYPIKATMISEHSEGGHGVYKSSTDGLKLIIDCNHMTANSHFLYLLLQGGARNHTKKSNEHFKQEEFNTAMNKNGSSNGNGTRTNVRPRESDELSTHASKTARQKLSHVKGSPASPGGVVMSKRPYPHDYTSRQQYRNDSSSAPRYVSGSTAMRESGMMKDVHAAPNRVGADDILKGWAKRDPAEVSRRSPFDTGDKKSYDSPTKNDSSSHMTTSSNSTGTGKGRETERGSTTGIFRDSPPQTSRACQPSSSSVLANRRSTAKPHERPNDKAMRQGATNHQSRGQKQMAANNVGALSALETSKRSNDSEWYTTNAQKAQKTYGTSKSFTDINSAGLVKSIDSNGSHSGFNSKPPYPSLTLTTTGSSNSYNNANSIRIRGLGKPEMIGIKNLGNTCYMSAILQCLLTLPNFKKDSNKKCQMMTQIINAGMLAILSRQSQSPTSSSKSPSSSLQTLGEPVKKSLPPASMTRGLFNSFSNLSSTFNHAGSLFGRHMGHGGSSSSSSSSSSNLIPPQTITEATLNSRSLVQQLRDFIHVKPEKNITDSRAFRMLLTTRCLILKELVSKMHTSSSCSCWMVYKRSIVVTFGTS
jgi:hypothetical protein